MAPGYGSVILDLKDGEKLVGILMKETEDTLTVKDATGAEQTIQKVSVSNRANAPSAMPTMKDVLDRRETERCDGFFGAIEK